MGDAPNEASCIWILSSWRFREGSWDSLSGKFLQKFLVRLAVRIPSTNFTDKPRRFKRSMQHHLV